MKWKLKVLKMLFAYLIIINLVCPSLNYSEEEYKIITKALKSQKIPVEPEWTELQNPITFSPTEIKITLAFGLSKIYDYNSNSDQGTAVNEEEFRDENISKDELTLTIYKQKIKIEFSWDKFEVAYSDIKYFYFDNNKISIKYEKNKSTLKRSYKCHFFLKKSVYIASEIVNLKKNIANYLKENTSIAGWVTSQFSSTSITKENQEKFFRIASKISVMMNFLTSIPTGNQIIKAIILLNEEFINNKKDMKVDENKLNELLKKIDSIVPSDLNEIKSIEKIYDLYDRDIPDFLRIGNRVPEDELQEVLVEGKLKHSECLNAGGFLDNEDYSPKENGKNIYICNCENKLCPQNQFSFPSTKSCSCADHREIDRLLEDEIINCEINEILKTGCKCPFWKQILIKEDSSQLDRIINMWNTVKTEDKCVIDELHSKEILYVLRGFTKFTNMRNLKAQLIRKKQYVNYVEKKFIKKSRHDLLIYLSDSIILKIDELISKIDQNSEIDESDVDFYNAIEEWRERYKQKKVDISKEKKSKIFKELKENIHSYILKDIQVDYNEVIEKKLELIMNTITGIENLYKAEPVDYLEEEISKLHDYAYNLKDLFDDKIKEVYEINTEIGNRLDKIIDLFEYREMKPKLQAQIETLIIGLRNFLNGKKSHSNNKILRKHIDKLLFEQNFLKDLELTISQMNQMVYSSWWQDPNHWNVNDGIHERTFLKPWMKTANKVKVGELFQNYVKKIKIRN